MAQTSLSLEEIDPFLKEALAGLEPKARARLAGKLLGLLQKANARRIAANQQPEGGAMPARKKRHGGKRGKMFKRIGRAKNLRTRLTPEGGELRFVNPLVEHTAATHHYGLEGSVGRTRRGRLVRTKYQARQLLGVGEEREALLEEVLRHMAAD